MSKASFTPGPWSIRTNGTMTGRGPEVFKDEPYFDDGSEFVIADCGTSEHRPGRGAWKQTANGDEVEANARLIAAAPDLIEALKRARTWIPSSLPYAKYIDGLIGAATGASLEPSGNNKQEPTK